MQREVGWLGKYHVLFNNVVITGGMCIFVGLQKKMTSTIWYYGNFL